MAGLSNFGNPWQLSQESMGAPNFTEALRKGLLNAQEVTNTAYKPKTMGEELLGKILQNKINKAKADVEPEMLQAQMDFLRGQTQNVLRQANTPFGGMLSGPARDAYAIEMLKNQLGENNPAYQSAKTQYELEQEATRGLNAYRQGLTQTASKRASSALGKLSQEEQDVMAGFEPNTNRQHQVTPDRQEELLGQYQLAKQKMATDTDTRKKTLFASNIDKTINAIDVKDLTRYAGLNGTLKLKQEEIKAATSPGSESETYRKYAEAANKAQLLAKQVRQFYGDSIQPTMLQKLERLANPSTWRTNPELATRLYKSFTGLLKQETGTYRSALHNKKEFEDNPSGIKKYNIETGRFE